jgi:hypothetical protein
MRGDFSPILEEPFGLHCDYVINRKGITVIDITDLDDVRYCFMFVNHEYGAKDRIRSV